METSGIDEAAPLVSELHGMGLRTDSVITVVDAEIILRVCKESDVAEEQIGSADFLVLNKADLVNTSRLRKAEKRIQKLNSRAIIFKTQHAAVETDLLFASSARRYRELAATAQGVRHSHPVEDGFESVSYKETGSLDRNQFERFLLSVRYPGNDPRHKTH